MLRILPPIKERGEGEWPTKLKLSPARTLAVECLSIYGGAPVRRPHPRFDAARNAWVTRAGGSLKILAKGQ